MRVGFIGLGAMGNPMAANLQKAGYELTIHDIRREQGRNLEDAGAVWATSPAETAERSDAVLLSALAPDGRLAISQDVFERIERPDRLEIDEASDLSQAALTGTTLGRCRIVNAVAAPPPRQEDATFRLT